MLLRNAKQLEGHALHAHDGVIGQVKDFYFDDHHWHIRYCVVETGKWVQKAPGTFCYTNDKAGSTEVCNTESVDDKGVWTTVSPDKKTATVVRVEG